MTKETKVLNVAKFKNKKDTPLEWANEILNVLDCSVKDRRNSYRIMNESNYNIKKECKRLEKYYEDKLKINVCHIVSALNSGGAETMIYNYCKKLSPDKYNFSILYQYEPLKKNVDELKKIRFKLRKVTSKKKNILSNYIETKRYLKENNIDVVHCHMTLANFIPLIAAKKIDIPVRISHSHEAGIEYKSLLKKMIYKIFKRLIISNSTVLISCGEKAGRFLYENEKFLKINNALEITEFQFNEECRNKIRNKYGIKENEILVGHVGRFIEVKNHKFILKTFNELKSLNKNYKLMLIGEGELQPLIKKEVARLNLERDVFFTGVVNNVNEYYSAFDIFILPSLREGLPMVSLEAQASGIKCFISEKVDISSKIIKENVQMLPLNSKKWVNEIIKIDLNYDRKISCVEFKENNLDINEERKKLDRIYTGNLEKET